MFCSALRCAQIVLRALDGVGPASEFHVVEVGCGAGGGSFALSRVSVSSFEDFFWTFELSNGGVGEFPKLLSGLFMRREVMCVEYIVLSERQSTAASRCMKSPTKETVVVSAKR